MRALAEDTKKLSLNCSNTNNIDNSINSINNNNNTTAIATTAITNTTTTTATTTAHLISANSSSDSNCKTKMQQLSTTTTPHQTPIKVNAKKQQSQQQHLNNNHNLSSTTIALPKVSHTNTSEEISGGVQDTIYLCNFRVSVDGEWLCLKELHDLDIGQQQSQYGSGTSTKSSYGGGGYYQASQRYALLKNKQFASFPSDGGMDDNNARDPAEIERSNLVNICKLVVKELLEQSLRYGRMLDSDHLPLQHFFIVIEHVLGHGLRPKKGLLGPRKELWDLLQSVENYCPEAQDITASVRDLPTVRTHIGRARAWLRIALMQKKLSDYLQALIEHREDFLYEYYESHALMMSDEIVIIMGILVGLNVIDCNLCVKEEDLDSQQGVIDFSLYLRSSSRNNESTSMDENQENTTNGQGNMIAVLDQKNYIEELNRHLNATVNNLQTKVESLTTTNALMKEDLAIARNSLLALQAENQAMRQQPNGGLAINLASAASMQSVHSDHSSNSSSDKVTIDSLMAELAEEKKRNNELSKELSLQISLKAESDMAMKLLEKDIHEKQDTIISLRRQLDDIKQINLEMYRKLQECEIQLKHKSELLTKLEAQKTDMSQTIVQLEQKWGCEKSNMGEILKTTSNTLSMQVTAAEERAARAEAECRIERDWRMSLQEKEIKLKENVQTLQNCVQELTDDLKRNDKLKDELMKMRTQWSEAQTTLEELGIQLSVSKLKVSELEDREKQQNLNKFYQHASDTMTETAIAPTQTDTVSAGIWAPDSIASHCTGCRKEFNLTRRKHHCRSCGEIFCKNCSEQTLPLMNENGIAGKPVRVCDSCFAAKK